MASLKEKLRSTFIVLDGPDGAGKSTQLDLLYRHLKSMDIPVTCVADPGGTPVGQSIRETLLNKTSVPINPACETLLFMASRAQLAATVIQPALSSGHTVLCDRYVSSTIAYQGALGEKIEDMITLARYATGDIWPDLTIILDIPVSKSLTRLGNQRDRMESRSTQYHESVANTFLQLEDIYPAPIKHIGSEGTQEETHAAIRKTVEDHFGNP